MRNFPAPYLISINRILYILIDQDMEPTESATRPETPKDSIDVDEFGLQCPWVFWEGYKYNYAKY